MLNDLDNLPNDTAELHGLVGQMANEIKSQALLIEKLRHQVAGQNTHRFGSKGEGIDQLQLRLKDEEVAEAATVPAEPPKQVGDDAKAKPKRKPLPEHLPRVDCRRRLQRLWRYAA